MDSAPVYAASVFDMASVHSTAYDGSFSSASTASVTHLPPQKAQALRRDFFVVPIPKRLQIEEGHPFRFTLGLNLVFAISTTICESTACNQQQDYEC